MAWEQPRVTFDATQAHRLQQLRELQGQQDPECSPVEDAAEEFGEERAEGHQQRWKKFKRAWREEWKTKHRWVFPIKNTEGELRLKCQWCSLYNMDNVFAREGCSTIQMSALNTHAKSEAHRTAEGRITGTDMSLATFPENLFDACKNGSEAGSRDAGGAGQVEGDSSTPGKKRKAAPMGKSESVAFLLQKNNDRISQLLAEAETGRNNRHANSVALARKQLKLEEQRLQLEQQQLEQDKARLAAQISLGQTFIAALGDISEGLKVIGSAIEKIKGTTPS